MVLMSLNPHPDLTPSVIFGLGWLYLLQFLMNCAWTYRSLKKDGSHRVPQFLGGGEVPYAMWWGVYTAFLSMVCFAHFTGYSMAEGFQIRLPLSFKTFVDDFIANPMMYFAFTTGVFGMMILFRRVWARVTPGWILFNLSCLFLTLSMTDYDFRQIVGKPDNVPIVAMLFIVGFFTWVYFNRSNENDQRIAEGRPVREAENNDKVLVWPDLVYTELIVIIAFTAFLVFWGIALEAPLEEPASSVKTPNPSKAPWYFLGLQEMLVYYDPWLAGVVFPGAIIGGMMAIPYIDFNKKGNGYYTFNERKFAVSTFMFGFLPLWVGMIILGTFIRGPNWNMFGIYEYWDVHKLEALNNVNLSEYFWLYWLKMSMPESVLLREAPGFVLVFSYLVFMPSVMAATIFKKFALRMGFIRFMVFSNLVLLMAALPLKMVLRWTMDLKYIIGIPEYFFNV
jgi:putative flippase GtrA